MTELTIRPARAADRPAIASLMAASWQSAYAPFLPPETLETLPQRFAEKWQSHASGPDDLILLAEAEGAPVAFVTFLAGDPVWIDNLHVRPDLRGGGIGRRLLAGSVAPLTARGARAAELTVITGNAPARAFYARMGGRVVAEEGAELFGTPLDVLRLRWDDIAVWADTGT